MTSWHPSGTYVLLILLMVFSDLGSFSNFPFSLSCRHRQQDMDADGIQHTPTNTLKAAAARQAASQSVRNERNSCSHSQPDQLTNSRELFKDILIRPEYAEYRLSTNRLDWSFSLYIEFK